VGQFRAICRAAPRKAVPLALPERVKADPARVAEVLQQLGPLQAARDPLQWARDLRDAEERGEWLTFLQRDNWRAALAHEVLPNKPDDFKPIAVELLPTTMRDRNA
jgi:hypothetical protein